MLSKYYRVLTTRKLLRPSKQDFLIEPKAMQVSTKTSQDESSNSLAYCKKWPNFLVRCTLFFPFAMTAGMDVREKKCIEKLNHPRRRANGVAYFRFREKRRVFARIESERARSARNVSLGLPMTTIEARVGSALIGDGSEAHIWLYPRYRGTNREAGREDFLRGAATGDRRPTSETARKKVHISESICSGPFAKVDAQIFDMTREELQLSFQFRLFHTFFSLLFFSFTPFPATFGKSIRAAPLLITPKKDICLKYVPGSSRNCAKHFLSCEYLCDVVK